MRVMRPSGLFVVVLLAAMASGCAGTTGQRLGAAKQPARVHAALPQTAPTQGDLDSLAYGSPTYAEPGHTAGARTQALVPVPAVAQSSMLATAPGPTTVAARAQTLMP